jgi:tRNA pseudouridine55 synthase
MTRATSTTRKKTDPALNAPRQQKRPPRRTVDGVLLLDKPQGQTSNGALQTARRLYNAAKAGHTGTLDPMATGLLPLTFGEATKFSQMLLDADKAYEATVRLGIETDTGDAEGRPIASAPVSVTPDEVARALSLFTGEIEQVPPMYSALKCAGKPLYEYARAGIEIERAPRKVRIHALEFVALEGDAFRIRVDCSKGTYIRTLAIDLGRALGCGAHLSALRRTRIGPFAVDAAVTLAALEAAAPRPTPWWRTSRASRSPRRRHTPCCTGGWCRRRARRAGWCGSMGKGAFWGSASVTGKGACRQNASSPPPRPGNRLDSV